MQDKFYSHAIKCGINMTHRQAVPLNDCIGRYCAVDVLHPETQDVLIAAGRYIVPSDYIRLGNAGVDYVVCRI